MKGSAVVNFCLVLNRKHIKPVTKSEKKNNQLKQRGNKNKSHESSYHSQVQALLERTYGKKTKKTTSKSSEILLKPATFQVEEEPIDRLDEYEVEPQPRMPPARPANQRLQRMQSNIFDSLEEVDDGAEEDTTKFFFPLKASALEQATFKSAVLDDDL